MNGCVIFMVFGICSYWQVASVIISLYFFMWFESGYWRRFFTLNQSSRQVIEVKRQARHHRGQDRLTQAAPASHDLLSRAAERGDNLGSITATLLRGLDH